LRRRWNVLGPSKDLSKLTLREWQGFIEDRRTGAIDADGERVDPENRRPVRDSTVAADCVFLIAVLNWATKWRENDRYLMQENPARGFVVPNEKNPRRPVVTEDRFQKVRAVATQVTTKVLVRDKVREIPSDLPEILDIANGSGRRISAILALRTQDLRLSEGGPYGAICWPAATDKMGKEWTVPITREMRSAINRILERRGIGAGYLFPAPNHPNRPVTIEVASAWLRKAEKLAGVEKQKGSLWHAYRRKWATERKYLPAVDVAAAGGWSDITTLTQVYQQADLQTMYRVVSEPAKLVESIG
jgi:integrase